MGYASTFVVLTIVSSIVLYGLLARQLRTERDLILTDRLGAVETLLKSPSHGFEELQNRVLTEWPLRGGEKVRIQVWDGDQREILKSPRTLEADSDTDLVGTRTIDNSVGLKNPVQVTAWVGGTQSRDFLSMLRKLLLAVCSLTALTSGFMGWLVVRREQRLNRLADSFERLSRFSSDIAHELRTPIQNMIGSLEVALARDRQPLEYREILGSNLEECNRISRLTESLLFLARAENLKEGISLSKLELRQEIERIIDFYEPLASEKSQRLILETRCNPQQILWADPVLFQRLMGNLISNAIRYTGRGGEIVVDYGVQETELVLSVRDSGQGIPPEDLPFIFDRFYRVDRSRSLDSGGTGLGLAIAKSIVDLHHAKIAVNSQPGQGSAFSIRWSIV
jgi:signal transduction histidine kinase